MRENIRRVNLAGHVVNGGGEFPTFFRSAASCRAFGPSLAHCACIIRKPRLFDELSGDVRYLRQRAQEDGRLRTWLTFCALPYIEYSDPLWLTLYVAKIKRAQEDGKNLAHFLCAAIHRIQ